MTVFWSKNDVFFVKFVINPAFSGFFHVFLAKKVKNPGKAEIMRNLTKKGSFLSVFLG